MINTYFKLIVGLTVLVWWTGCNTPQLAPDEYLFFLHGRFLEDHPVSEAHPTYGIYAYDEIIEGFENAGLQVISEIRTPNTNAYDYAQQIVQQIDSLLESGVAPQRITVAGASKGGYIAQYVSTLARNPKLNFVFIAAYRDSDITQIPDIQFCGNILTIYEASDVYGVSAKQRVTTSSLSIPTFEEIELATGLEHGFLFQALAEWMNPTVAWAKQYDNQE